LSDTLPQYVASLSKYIRVEKYYDLLSSITHDIPESQLRAQFDPDLYTTAKARYLVVENGVVRRDKLVDLIHEEGTFTERVKMVMYFLFVFRDRRYREFVCRVVARQNGKWDTKVFSDSHSEFFEHAGGRKAFTNLRQFLCQTGIIEESSWAVHMPNPAEWFPVAAEIAAYSIEDAIARRNFVTSPHGFLIKNRINALLNTTPEDLSNLQLGGICEQSENLLPEIELPESSSTVEASDFKEWNRTSPLKRRRNSAVSITDPIALERADSQHFWLEERMFTLLKQNGLAAMTSKYVDLMIDRENTSVLFEMKSCRPGAVRPQIRRAVSQLLEYRFLYRKKLQPNVVLCAVVERKPRGKLTWMTGYLESLGICLIWRNDDSESLGCTDTTKNSLRLVLPQVAEAEF
jgi:hypothetical protein